MIRLKWKHLIKKENLSRYENRWRNKQIWSLFRDPFAKWKTCSKGSATRIWSTSLVCRWNSFKRYWWSRIFFLVVAFGIQSYFFDFDLCRRIALLVAKECLLLPSPFTCCKDVSLLTPPRIALVFTHLTHSVRFAINDVIILTKGSLNMFFVVTVMRGVSRFRPSLFGPPETPERRFRSGSGLGPLFVTRRATPSTRGCCFVTS